MRALVWAACALLIAALMPGGNAGPARAEIVYPWCGNFSGGEGGVGAPNCGFTSFEQCMAAVSGNQGTCSVNPLWVPPDQRGQLRRSATVYVPAHP
jgi:hypothetical protein